MKKFSILFLISFVFCLGTLLGGVSLSQSVSADNSTIALSDASFDISDSNSLTEALSDYNNYGTINLTSDLSNITITSTLGTYDNPFTGVFNGNGHTISNLTIDLSESETSTGYVGFFGVLSGATIQNLTLTNVTIITASGTSSYNIGALCGMATDSTFKNIFINSAFNVTGDFSVTTNFGGMIGQAENCNISNCIVRTTSSLTLSNSDNHIYTYGALVGRLDNTSVVFTVIESTLNISLSNAFVGSVSVGGVVGFMTGGSLTNIAVENSFNAQNSSTSDINLGEIVGALSTSVPPISGDISYIHYKSNGYDRFGDRGAYSYGSSGSYDYVTASVYSLSSLVVDSTEGGYTYFSQQTWDPFLGEWDFDTVWYVATRIYLQCFRTYTVSISSVLNSSSVFTATISDSTTSGDYGYDSTVVLQFRFKNTSDGLSMSQFYLPTALTLGGTEVATIYTDTSNDEISYSLSENDYYTIESATSTDGTSGFDITISAVNSATAGTYSVNYSQVEYSITITTKLFDEDGNETETIPGYVYYANLSNATTLETLSISKVSYGSEYSIGTRAQSSVPCVFGGWYIGDEKISESTTLNFTFGSGDYVGDLEIYARYNADACRIICNITSDGVVKVVFSNSTEVTENGGYFDASKNDTTLIIQIYIASGYDFNVDDFIAMLDTFKVQDPNLTFCSYQTEWQGDDGEKVYQFLLDMTALNLTNYGSNFSITINATEQTSDTNTIIWIVVGSICGALVLAGLIILIIFLVKRGGGGFGGGTKIKFDKKAYKNMYY